jgi:hypothetical protein
MLFAMSLFNFSRLFLFLTCVTRVTFGICEGDCQNNCSSIVKSLCVADKNCGGVWEWPCYVPGSYVLSLCNAFAVRGDACTSNPRPNGDDSFYYYLDPTDNVTWLGGVGKAMTCKGTQTLPNITGWSGVCYVNPQVPNDCPTRPRPAERLVSIWQPGFDNETGAEILSGIVAHPNTFNAISNTWAYWNSEWNPKCNNSYHGLCFEEFSNDMWPILKELNESYNVNILPIIETCCVCVLNASYDFTPAMTRLVQDSLTYGFAGTCIRPVCGGNDAPRSIEFFDAFAALMHPLGKTVSWWTHYDYAPETSFPNAADYCYTMDSYEYTTPQFVGTWINEFQCQAGIGLEFAGNGNVNSTQAMFDLMTNSTTLQAAGVWGYLPNDNKSLTELWWSGLKQFRDGWSA